MKRIGNRIRRWLTGKRERLTRVWPTSDDRMELSLLKKGKTHSLDGTTSRRRHGGCNNMK